MSKYGIGGYPASAGETGSGGGGGSYNGSLNAAGANGGNGYCLVEWWE
jgi:hypothetical protein